MTLVDFLLARIADDEAAARDAWGVRWSTAYGMSVWKREQNDDGTNTMIAECWSGEDGKHIATHSPARVLVDCAAKRLTVRFLSDLERGEFGDTMTSSLAYSNLCRMATVYDYHADYRQEWKP